MRLGQARPEEEEEATELSVLGCQAAGAGELVQGLEKPQVSLFHSCDIFEMGGDGGELAGRRSGGGRETQWGSKEDHLAVGWWGQQVRGPATRWLEGMWEQVQGSLHSQHATPGRAAVTGGAPLGPFPRIEGMGNQLVVFGTVDQLLSKALMAAAWCCFAGLCHCWSGWEKVAWGPRGG